MPGRYRPHDRSVMTELDSVARIAHALNNELNAILVVAELALLDAHQSQCHSDLRVITRAGARSAALVRDLQVEAARAP